MFSKVEAKWHNDIAHECTYILKIANEIIVKASWLIVYGLNKVFFRVRSKTYLHTKGMGKNDNDSQMIGK